MGGGDDVSVVATDRRLTHTQGGADPPSFVIRRHHEPHKDTSFRRDRSGPATLCVSKNLALKILVTMGGTLVWIPGYASDVCEREATSTLHVAKVWLS
jgi:hypothetical protein